MRDPGNERAISVRGRDEVVCCARLSELVYYCCSLNLASRGVRHQPSKVWLGSRFDGKAEPEDASSTKLDDYSPEQRYSQREWCKDRDSVPEFDVSLMAAKS